MVVGKMHKFIRTFSLVYLKCEISPMIQGRRRFCSCQGKCGNMVPLLVDFLTLPSLLQRLLPFSHIVRLNAMSALKTVLLI
jgi:hypothetical protein